MGLSTDLISQFAKITNDGIERKEEEVTLYGTITTREGDDSLYLRLDGSTELTPVVSSSTIEPGDRVSAIIKNHTAMVTGNFSDPSVGSGKVSIVLDQKYGAIFTGTEDGTTMINGAYIQTGTISADSIDLTGKITFACLSPNLDSFLEDLVDETGTAMDDASEAKKLAKSIANGNYVKGTFIDGTHIMSPTIEGNKIRVYGTFQTRGYIEEDERWKTTGYMGAAKGLDALGEDTYGVALSYEWDSDTGEMGDIYVIVTNGGVRLQAGNNRIVVTEDTINLIVKGSGKAYYNGSEIATKDDLE